MSKYRVRNLIRPASMSSASKLQWRSEGYETWIWKREDNLEIRVNYVARGIDKPGDPLVLIHGFGASYYHWRHQLPELADDRPVFALDLVGFGLTDKPIIDYSPELWRDQVHFLALNFTVVKSKIYLYISGAFIYR